MRYAGITKLHDFKTERDFTVGDKVRVTDTMGQKVIGVIYKISGDMLVMLKPGSAARGDNIRYFLEIKDIERVELLDE